MNHIERGLSRRNFISTPAKFVPAVALVSAMGLTVAASAQGGSAMAAVPASQGDGSVMQGGNKKVVIIATGGTIAGTADSSTELVAYTAAQRTVHELLAGIPIPENIDFEAIQLAQVDSKDMNFKIWRDLATKVEEVLARSDVDGIVITHGTDTLEESAYFLSLAVDATKPVVFTAAMRPSTALGADGPLNLLDSITVASSDAKGVMAVLDGYIYSGKDVRKGHTTRVQAFSAGEAGALGTVEGNRIRQWRTWPVSAPILKPSQLPVDVATWPWVEIIQSNAGTTGAVVPALVGAGVNGIVVAATGNGTIHENLIPYLQEAQIQGVKVVRAGRVGDGVISSADDDGILRSDVTLPVKARVLMIAELLQG